MTLELGTKPDKLDVGARTGSVGSKVFEFERLPIATGSEPNPLPVPGGQLAGVYLLRTLFYLKKARLVAALFANRNPDVEPTKALIQQRLQVDLLMRSRLADPAFDLKKLRSA